MIFLHTLETRDSVINVPTSLIYVKLSNPSIINRFSVSTVLLVYLAKRHVVINIMYRRNVVKYHDEGNDI